jgi:hypothetical protein
MGLINSCTCNCVHRLTRYTAVVVLQESIPRGSAQLNAVMYFDGIQQDSTGFVSVDGGIVQGAFFRRAAREQNEAMRSICSFIEVPYSPPSPYCICTCRGIVWVMPFFWLATIQSSPVESVVCTV